MMTDCSFLDLKGLPQKSNDLLSLFRTYSLCTSFNEIIKSLKKVPPTFTIITKNSKYQCHLEIIAAVSKLIFQAIQNDPKLNEFAISQDFDDSKFDQFVSFLNGDKIIVSDDNRSYLKSISELLQIDNLNFNPDVQNELILNRFSKNFHLIMQDIPKTINLTNENGTYSVDYLIAMTYSKILIESAASNTNQININLNTQGDISEIIELLNDNIMNINIENYSIIEGCLSELGITLNNDVLGSIIANFKFYSQIISTINLYDTILDINCENIDEIQQLLSKSDFYLNSDLHHQLYLALENAFVYRPRYFESVITLISKLQNEAFKKSLLTYLPKRVLSYQISIPFLRSLYDEKVISHDELIQILKLDLCTKDHSLFIQPFTFSNNLKVFFAKEFYNFDTEKFTKLVESKHGFYFRHGYKISELKQYIGNWDEYEKKVNMHYISDNLYEAILKDDVDTFQAITSHQGNFDYDQKLKTFLFEKSEDLLEDVTYACVAAFYGSIRCFRFLLLQQVNISKCAKYAVIGGNSEIIRLVKQNEGSFSDLYHIAIKYHRYDIFKWLIMNEGPIKDLYQGNFRRSTYPSLQTSIQSCNNRALLYFYDNGIDNTVIEDEDINLIDCAIISLNADALKLLFKTFLINPNKYSPSNRDNKPPICFAADIGFLEAIKMLIEIGKVEIPKKKEINPLILAAKKGYVDIVEYLAPLYKDNIDDSYLEAAVNEKIREILLSNKK